MHRVCEMLADADAKDRGEQGNKTVIIFGNNMLATCCGCGR